MEREGVCRAILGREIRRFRTECWRKLGTVAW